MLFCGTLTALPIDAARYGFIPGTGADMTPNCKLLLQACTNSADTITFTPGSYHFYPARTGARTTAFNISAARNLTIEGSGAAFIFHGIMNPFNIENTQKIEIRGISIDWERPLLTQGQIVSTGTDFADIRIDKALYPFEVIDNKAWFTGDDWRRELEGYHNIYDQHTQEIVYLSRDNPLGIHAQSRAEEIQPGVLRLQCKPQVRPEPGTYIALNHGRYIIPCFSIKSSADVVLKNITVYHCLSHGVVASRTENLTLNGFNITVNKEKKRVFSCVADGFHLVNCRGDVLVENCAHTGIGDDFLNTHGKNCVVKTKFDNRTVLIKNGYGTEAGDEVWLLRKADAQRREIYTVAHVEAVKDPAEKGWLHKVSFEQDLPADFNQDDFLENKSWNATLTLRNCRILKRHRARGILVTTPEKVLIENNYFRTAGTAILIEGDVDYWYESGANRDVTIRNNIFEDCLSSGSQTGGKWEWGEAIITITPSCKPQNASSLPYHQNIRIEKNTFKTFDIPLVRARSVGGLTFRNNTIERTHTYEPFAWQQAAFWLDGCHDVLISDNSYDSDYQGTTIWTEHMQPADLKMQDTRNFQIIDCPK
jgi:hypothetical protein